MDRGAPRRTKVVAIVTTGVAGLMAAVSPFVVVFWALAAGETKEWDLAWAANVQRGCTAFAIVLVVLVITAVTSWRRVVRLQRSTSVRAQHADRRRVARHGSAGGRLADGRPSEHRR